MKRPLLMLSAGITLLLSGCSLDPEYMRPDVALPDTWPRGEAYKNLAADEDNARDSQAAQSWRDYFPDGSLQKIIELSLENNRDLRLAVLNVERTRDLYSIQRAELYPTLNASGVGSKQRLSLDLVKAGEDRMREQYNVDLGIAAWEIDLFGRMRLLKDQALETYLASEETLRQARIALVAEVAGTYLSLAADRERLRLARSTLETQRSSHALVQKLFDRGMASEPDLKRAQIPMDMARIEVARLTGLVAQDRNALNLPAATTVDEELLPAELAIQTAFREVADTLAVQGTIEEQLSAQESLVNTADEAYDLAQKRYTEGIDSYLDVLDAQRTLVSAKQGLVSLKLAELGNLTRLYSVLGGERGKAEEGGETDQAAPSDSGT